MIGSTDFRALFTKKLVAVYQERIRPTSFLRLWFPMEYAGTKEVSIEVERSFERVAVDVLRGTEGNRNQWTRSTEKIFAPPYFKESFDLTQLAAYDQVLGAQANGNMDLFAGLLNKAADRLSELQDKIERAQELQCAQVLEDGIVQIRMGLNIDYNRKSESMVDLAGAGGYFVANSDVFAQFQAAGEFIRTVGKSGAVEFNAIFGATAWNQFLRNTVFTSRQNLFHMRLDSVAAPTKAAQGSAYNGSITAGPYTIHLWTYPQFYDVVNETTLVATATPYIDDKKVIVMPTVTKMKMVAAACPQLIAQPGAQPTQTGPYRFMEKIDEWETTHQWRIECAPLAIPIAVDQIYTMQAVAS